MDNFENGLQATLDALMDAVTKENEEKYGAIVTNMLKAINDSPYDFEKPDIFNTMIAFPLEEIMDNVVKNLHKQQNEEVEDKFKPQFIFLHYQFLSSNIEKFIEKRMESSSCVVDKSRYILKMYLDYSLTGEIPETDLEEHYWIPRFGTNEDWMAFCDGLYKLFYGNNDLYLTSYEKLLNEEIRRYPHTKYVLSAKFCDGNKRIVEQTYDKPVLLPPVKDEYYIISKLAFSEKMRYDDAEDGDEYFGRFFYKVPKNEILGFEALTEEVML